jgi:hypothetical protein
MFGTSKRAPGARPLAKNRPTACLSFYQPAAGLGTPGGIAQRIEATTTVAPGFDLLSQPFGFRSRITATSALVGIDPPAIDHEYRTTIIRINLHIQGLIDAVPAGMRLMEGLSPFTIELVSLNEADGRDCAVAHVS